MFNSLPPLNKKLPIRIILASLFCFYLTSVLGQTGPVDQPEDFTQHRTLYDIAPAKTLYIQEKDPKKATELLTELHDSQAKLGWRIFNVIAYQKDEDFRGFFVTYVKVGEVD